MAAVAPGVSVNMSGHIQNQLTRSLERILEDANLSGELKLSGRKLKDFPKTGKYNLSDTVIADLSKNRFGEVPDEVTAFLFLERLLLFHNAIRSVPDTIGMLQSLSHLDLSRNQLSEVPREICLLPLQVLLLSHNRLTGLPKEIGRMTSLAELDAAGNLISQLPISIGDLRNLRALNLRANQLGLLPLQITYLQLEMLDVSCNCISSLPLELRHMSTLVTLNLEHNPLVSPPATTCVRGRIHIFKYLENQAMKDTRDRRCCGPEEPPRRALRPPPPGGAPPQPPAVEGLRHKARYNVDSGYSTSDGGEKRWSSDGLVGVDEGGGASGRSTPSTPSTLSPSPAPPANHSSRGPSLTAVETPPATPTLGSRVSPDSSNLINGDDKSKLINHQQTYRQYKEALRQQRQQDVYRPRGEQISPPSATPSPSTQSHSTPHSPVANGYHHRPIGSSSPSLASPVVSSSSNNNPSSPIHSNQRRFQASMPSSTLLQTNGLPSHNEAVVQATNLSVRVSGSGTPEDLSNKRPVQKVVPSRSSSKTYSPTGIPVSNSNNSISPVLNGNADYSATSRLSQDRSPQEGSYVKPVSPIKGVSSYMSHNNVPMNRSNSLGRTNLDSPGHTNAGTKLLTTSVGYTGNTLPAAGNPLRINWSKDLPPDKLSFTMKREFDRAKEESELIQQLRSIIENRLKMSLPRDLAPVLSDGVVLCHLANHVRPRAVASVHVPSPAQPKLTMARCRRNVDNFLEACRKIGVEEGAVCQPQDILPQETDDQPTPPDRWAAILTTVTQLLALRGTTAHATDNHASSQPQEDPYEGGTTRGDQPDESAFVVEPQNSADSNVNEYQQSEETADGGDEDIKKPFDNVSEKFRNNLNFFQSKPLYRNRYAEDRCISNFNAFGDDSDANTFSQNDCNNFVVNRVDNIHFQNNNAESTVDNNKITFLNNADINPIPKRTPFPQNSIYSYNNIEKNKINFVVPLVNGSSKPSSPKRMNISPDDGLVKPVGDDSNQSLITKRVKFFTDKRLSLNLNIENNLNTILTESIAVTERDKVISRICLGIFIFTLLFLYIFPLPN